MCQLERRGFEAKATDLVQMLILRAMAQKGLGYTRAFDPWRLFAGASQDGLQLELKLPYSVRKISALQNSPGVGVEVTASVCGENVLVAGAGNLCCRG